MKIFLLITCSVALACSAVARSKKDVPYIHLQPSGTLHVQVIDNVWYGRGGIGLDDRFRRIKSTLEEVLEELDFPMECKITRFGPSRTPANQPRLDLTIMKWGGNGMSEIEVRFGASLKLEYDRNKLGIFYHRGGTAFGTSDQMVRVYNDILREALTEMIIELSERFDFQTLEEGEIEVDEDGVDAPIGSKE